MNIEQHISVLQNSEIISCMMPVKALTFIKLIVGHPSYHLQDRDRFMCVKTVQNVSSLQTTLETWLHVTTWIRLGCV